MIFFSLSLFFLNTTCQTVAGVDLKQAELNGDNGKPDLKQILQKLDKRLRPLLILILMFLQLEQ